MIPLHHRIIDFAPEGSRVIDLGCGDGQLLRTLKENKNIDPLGVEIDLSRLEECVENGVPVIQMDIDKGLQLFGDDHFDLAILRYTLSEVHQPLVVFKEMLRVAKSAIIVFSNFAHWQIRWSLLAKGKMPVSQEFPHEWYDTPNIHFLSVEDVERLVRNESATVIHREFHSPTGLERGLNGLGFYNLTAKTALFHVKKN